MSECSEWNPLDFQCPYACRYCPERGHRDKPRLAPDWKGIPGTPWWRYGVWVAANTDMFHPGVPKRMISKILGRADEVGLDDHRFVFCSKNSARFAEFIPSSRAMRDGLLVTTVESDVDYGMTRAPSPQERLDAMRMIHAKFPGQTICLAVKPVMKFTEDFADAIRAVGFSEVSIDREAVGFPNFPAPDIMDVMELAKKIAKPPVLRFPDSHSWCSRVLIGGRPMERSSRRATWPPNKTKIGGREQLLWEWGVC